jgi:DNA polymerase (family 10)
VKIANGMQADLRIVPEGQLRRGPDVFHRLQGPQRQDPLARAEKKMTLNEWGLYKLDEYESAEKEIAKPPEVDPVASQTEADIYKTLGLAYVEPELREDRGEVDAAKENRLPKLLTLKDIRGDLHLHTTESDGTASIEEMALAAKALGYEFLAITDHSKALGMTNGLSEERLLKHIENVHRISDKLKGITLLAGSEVDILVDGQMDYADDILKELDIVIASPHVSLKQDTKKATDRLLRAINNRYCERDRATPRVDDQRPRRAAAGPRTHLQSRRRDRHGDGDQRQLPAAGPERRATRSNARAAGVMISINTDAHSTGELHLMPFGLDVARRAWLTSRT